jgi:hypothetical protein
VIAADSSSFIAHLSGDQGEDVEILDQALHSSVSDLFKALPLLETRDGYWERAGTLRAKASRTSSSHLVVPFN